MRDGHSAKHLERLVYIWMPPLLVLPTQFFPQHPVLCLIFLTLSLRMPKKYLSEEGICILTLREQNDPIEKIYSHVGQPQATIFHLLAAACAHKPIPG